MERENKTIDNPFFCWAKPYFDFIGKGKIYSLIYVIMALGNLLLPLIVIFVVIESGLMQYTGTNVVVAFMFSLLVIAFASWIGFQLWWNRKSSIKRFESADFIATPVLSEILQTFGEWLGTFMGILGVGVGIIMTILLWDIQSSELGIYGIRTFFNFGPAMIIGGPVAGFFTIVLFRFLAEQIRIISSIANNTRDIARTLRK